MGKINDDDEIVRPILHHRSQIHRMDHDHRRRNCMANNNNDNAEQIAGPTNTTHHLLRRTTRQTFDGGECVSVLHERMSKVSWEWE